MLITNAAGDLEWVTNADIINDNIEAKDLTSGSDILEILNGEGATLTDAEIRFADADSDKVLITDDEGNPVWADKSDLVVEPWQVQGTTDKATENTENIYQIGSVAIGKNEAISEVMLDVQGSIRGGSQNDQDPIGQNSIAVGQNVVASGSNSAAFGQNVTASGDGSMALGDADGQTVYFNGFPVNPTPSVVSGHSSYVQGYGNNVSGMVNSATGMLNEVDGMANSVTGYGNQVENGMVNVVHGINNKVENSLNSVVIGANNETDINASNAFIAGVGNKLSVTSAVVFGNFNAINESEDGSTRGFNGRRHQAFFQIGNGRNNEVRYNALTILNQGFVGIGIDGTGESAKPQYTLDIGRHEYYSDGKGGLVRIQK